MKLDLSQLFEGTVYKLELEEKLDINVFNENITNQRNIKLKEPVSITGNMYYTEDGIYLDAKLAYEYIEDCARCLTEFSEKIETVISGKIMKKSNQPIEEDDDEIIIYYDGEELEIEDNIISSILLSLPMKSLCKQDCKGLCDKCGKDLNAGQCDCTKEDIDPRLAKLKDLFD
ncbi:hypothetical protein DUF177 [Gottschalkia acidurici 9a]|uniref:DUF177 domain-containing protein n=1 Tax=Gottschalkia acidurici (strain ATCC 7906 / DSM 604 / BCRC 14475 / CIP 104303 / KCTC 5404 / NCIMB 10678 / 9a) TaxID=1128398 RepID=K0B1S3_GOTA9|nr:DUF177 domain-containing protein [Gottschalkia acidurici]AFS78646.1 hypothetical protein DUF177 [Gottschalkia acidurici 9a]